MTNENKQKFITGSNMSAALGCLISLFLDVINTAKSDGANIHQELEKAIKLRALDTDLKSLSKVVDDILTALKDYALRSELPENVSELTNDAQYQTKAEINAIIASLKDSAPDTLNTLGKIATKLSGVDEQITDINSSLSSKANRSELPKKVSELTNDKKYQTKEEVDQRIQDIIGSAPSDLDTLGELADKLKDNDDIHVALVNTISKKANQDDIPTKVSQLQNDENFISEVYWDDIKSKPSTFTPSTHTHTFASLTSKPTTLAGYGITDAKIDNGVITIGTKNITPLTSHQSLTGYAKTTDIPTKVSELTNDSGFISSVSWDDVKSKPSTFTPSSHTHTKSQITDFPTTWDWGNISNKPASFTPATHSHTFDSLSGKPTTIAGYGITDAKIANDVITLGAQTITPIQKGTDATKVLLANGSTINYYKAESITTATSDDGILTPLGMKNWTEKTFQPIGDYVTVNTKDGVVEVGRYFDFHTTNYFGKDGKPDEDYTVRIDGGTSTDKRVFTFPSAGGTFATESFVKNNDITKSISYRLGDGVSATSGKKRWIRIAKATDATASALINLCNSYFDENSDCVLLYVNKGYNVGDANSVIQQLGGRGGTKIFTKARWVVKSHTEEAYLEVYYDCTSGRNTLLINATNVHKMEFYTTPTDGEIPSGYRVVSEIDLTKGIVSDSFKKIGGTSSQFLKADGSVDSNKYVTSDQAVLRGANGYIQMQKTDAMFYNSNTGFALYHFACENPDEESDMPGYCIEYLARTNSVYIQTLNWYVEEESNLYFNDSKIITEANQKTLLPIAVEVQDGGLYVVNHEQLTKAGLVPYIFRRTKKKNGYHWNDEEYETDSHSNYKKGWNVRGYCGTTRIDQASGRVNFYGAKNCFEDIGYKESDYSYYPDDLVKIGKSGCLCWGAKKIDLGDYECYPVSYASLKSERIAHSRYVVLPFGIAFGKPIPFGKKITLADMATPLAQFTLRSETKDKVQDNPKGYPFGGFVFAK